MLLYELMSIRDGLLVERRTYRNRPEALEAARHVREGHADT